MERIGKLDRAPAFSREADFFYMFMVFKKFGNAVQETELTMKDATAQFTTGLLTADLSNVFPYVND